MIGSLAGFRSMACTEATVTTMDIAVIGIPGLKSKEYNQDQEQEKLVKHDYPKDHEQEKLTLNGNSKLIIKVQGMHGDEVFFIQRTGATFMKLMDSYCARQCMDLCSFKFLFDGRLLGPWHTPLAVEMEDGDTIDAWVDCNGG